MDYDSPEGYGAKMTTASALRHIPLRAQLQEELHQHQKEIQRITQLIELLDNNQAIEQFINLQRGYIR